MVCGGGTPFSPFVDTVPDYRKNLRRRLCRFPLELVLSRAERRTSSSMPTAGRVRVAGGGPRGERLRTTGSGCFFTRRIRRSGLAVNAIFRDLWPACCRWLFKVCAGCNCGVVIPAFANTLRARCSGVVTRISSSIRFARWESDWSP